MNSCANFFLSIQSILFNKININCPPIKAAVYRPGSLLFRKVKLRNRQVHCLCRNKHKNHLLLHFYIKCVYDINQSTALNVSFSWENQRKSLHQRKRLGKGRQVGKLHRVLKLMKFLNILTWKDLCVNMILDTHRHILLSYLIIRAST